MVAPFLAQRANGRPVAALSAPSAYEGAVGYVAKQTERAVHLHPSREFYPTVVKTPTNGIAVGQLAEWKGAHAPGSWTSGFWPGALWQLAALSPARTPAYWGGLAQQYAEGLKPTQFNTGTHDVGFMIHYSYGLGYGANASLRAEYGPVIFNTARSLASRFNSKVGCTESWSAGKHCNSHSAHQNVTCPFTVIIDNMMNLEVLLFAALKVNNAHCNCTTPDRQALVHVADTHAHTTAHHHVRADGSVNHIVCYDPATGDELFACNGGGYEDNTTWARGQAWAIYGFTMVHRCEWRPFRFYSTERQLHRLPPVVHLTRRHARCRHALPRPPPHCHQTRGLLDPRHARDP